MVERFTKHFGSFHRKALEEDINIYLASDNTIDVVDMDITVGKIFDTDQYQTNLTIEREMLMGEYRKYPRNIESLKVAIDIARTVDDAKEIKNKYNADNDKVIRKIRFIRCYEVKEEDILFIARGYTAMFVLYTERIKDPFSLEI